MDDIDEELDDNNKTWIQVIFEDLSPIDEDTVESDDFVVEGHTVKDVKTYGDDADEGEGAKTRRWYSSSSRTSWLRTRRLTLRWCRTA